MLKEHKKLIILFLALFLIFSISVKGLKHKGGLKKDKEKPKIILIAIDSASWPIINRLIEQDRLPNLAVLMKNGASSLEQEIPGEIPRCGACVPETAYGENERGGRGNRAIRIPEQDFESYFLQPRAPEAETDRAD